MSRPLQLTLGVLKPDLVANPLLSKEVQKIILRNGFFFVKTKKVKLAANQAEAFYGDEHKGKFFFPRLVNYMTSGEVIAHILARSDGIAYWRQVMGPTKVFKTIYSSPNSIRGRYGLSDTRNAVHGSDSEKSAEREIGFYFPEFDFKDWFANEEEAFAKKLVLFDEDACCHRSLTV